MKQAEIKFGTDGWRGVIAEDFTFERVRHAAAALAESLESAGGESRAVYVGWDRRFLSRDFARAAAEVLAGAGFQVRIANGFVPTPAVSLAVKDARAAAGIVITASHNPPRWNGFKVKETFGGSARPTTTEKLESTIARRLAEKTRPPRVPYPEGLRSGQIEEVDLGAGYLAALRRQVDLDAISRADVRVFVDPIHGAGAGFLSGLLRKAGVETHEIRGEGDPCFGGVNPEPIEGNLGALRRAMAAAGDGPPCVGLALDGDADRIGAFDEELEFFDSHRIFAAVLRHLCDVRQLPGSVVQTVSSTVMVRRLAESRKRTRIETNIGFKHVAEHMQGGGVLMGGEESGGLGFEFHLPERDGALSGLLLLEACAHRGLPPKALLREIFEETGEWHYDRVDVELPSGRRAEIAAHVKSLAPAEIAGAAVSGSNDRDGLKFHFEDDAWLLLRPSGTEPVLRIYAEAPSPSRVRELLAAGRALAVG